MKRKSEVVTEQASQSSVREETPHKSAIPSVITPGDSQANSARSVIVKNSVIVSEDEEEDDGGAIRKAGMRIYTRKSRISTPPEIVDKSLQAMMDVDDGKLQSCSQGGLYI